MADVIIPAICCMGYNRPNSIKRLLNSISRGIYHHKGIPLIISIDESSLSNQVEEVAKEFCWEYGEKTIIRYDKRQGIQKHALICGDLSIKYGAVIMLEDDVVVAPNYYNYVEQAFQHYGSDDERVFGFGLYSEAWNHYASLPIQKSINCFDTYWAGYDISWGQCWIGERWKSFRAWFDMNNGHLPEVFPALPKAVLHWDSNKSWSKYISFYMAQKKLYYVTPFVSLSTNMSEKGTHATYTNDKSQVIMLEGEKNDYSFGSYLDSVRLDAFFDRENPIYTEIEGIEVDQICFDFDGVKYSSQGKRFFLSTQILDFPVLKSWSVNLAPIENNIIFNNYGDGLYLYDLGKECSNLSPQKRNDKVLMHYLSNYTSRQLFRALYLKVINHCFKKH